MLCERLRGLFLAVSDSFVFFLLCPLPTLAEPLGVPTFLRATDVGWQGILPFLQPDLDEEAKLGRKREREE